MKKTTSVGAKPAQERSPLQRVLKFARGEAVRTAAGLRSAVRLRPGDRLETGTQRVLWVAVGQQVQVFTGAEPARIATDLPRLGRVSPETGKLEFRRPVSSAPSAPTRLH
ncbi:hypothetical protein [Tropicimonas sediminicola]|uniref:Uncharacterized protein n=1 Tax=Tropicimonas sediminicola TaxID=1031541 RepID=A0A239JVD7_9RHOB|nr:hypothetical protein [Tropicimonas sediminicola]SNT09418.1 hypothetical protein SAMN05421757_10673 [Tropicimonas sediminicola]